MRIVKVLLAVLVVLLVLGMALPDDAFARGGGRGGRGGRGGGGRGRFKGRDGKEIVDRAALIETAEAEMHNEDRENRFQSGRKSDYDAVLASKREEVLARHRRMAEDTRRQEDSRLEVSR